MKNQKSNRQIKKAKTSQTKIVNINNMSKEEFTAEEEDNIRSSCSNHVSYLVSLIYLFCRLNYKLFSRHYFSVVQSCFSSNLTSLIH